MRQYHLIDQLIFNVDDMLRTLLPIDDRSTNRTSPATNISNQPLSAKEQKHIAGLMRVNHSGEVCAQALYQGQALTAYQKDTKEKMRQSAQEEIDHLGWCEIRLKELNSHTSALNLIWFTLSFLVGASAGLIGDKWSLGFVVETERQVTKHLEGHLNQLPDSDQKSKAIIEQMIIDESAHATTALEAGGHELPTLIKVLMKYTSKLMTNTSYYF